MTVALSPMNLLLCKVLDYYIIIGSFIVKIPQLRKIWVAKSGQGLALTSVTIEMLAHCSKTAYAARREFPFTSYGEGVFLMFQNCAIGVLVLRYSGRSVWSCLYPVLTVMTMGALMSPGVVDMRLLVLMQAGNLLVTIVSKVIQAVTNMKNRGTGQLSKTTTTLYVSGLLARVYTSIQETGDVFLVSRYLVSTFFNALLLAQIIFYRPKSTGCPATPHKGQYEYETPVAKTNGHNGHIKHSTCVAAATTTMVSNGHSKGTSANGNKLHVY